MQTIRVNTIIRCHRTHSWKIDENANADVECEQGFTVNNFEKYRQLRNVVTLMKLNILQKLFRNCQREYKLEHQCKTW